MPSARDASQSESRNSGISRISARKESSFLSHDLSRIRDYHRGSSTPTDLRVREGGINENLKHGVKGARKTDRARCKVSGRTRNRMNTHARGRRMVSPLDKISERRGENRGGDDDETRNKEERNNEKRDPVESKLSGSSRRRDAALDHARTSAANIPGGRLKRISRLRVLDDPSKGPRRRRRSR
jgi:hypothetical protein